MASNNNIKSEGKMKLQTQLTVPHKQLRDLDYVKEIEILEETLKKESIDYSTQEDCLVCCYWLSIINFFIAHRF